MGVYKGISFAVLLLKHAFKVVLLVRPAREKANIMRVFNDVTFFLRLTRLNKVPGVLRLTLLYPCDSYPSAFGLGLTIGIS